MSFRLACPICGPRDVNEFRFQGELTRRPRTRPSLRELAGYVYFRDNVAGVQQEWWYHRLGCGRWFIAERDTTTNEVLATALPSAHAPSRSLPGVPEPPSAA
jgi:heterotetrameric sarcosine oxidase delta subunit